MRRKDMRKRTFWVFVLMLGMAGCATMEGGVQKGLGSPPVLESVFLSSEVNWGDTMKLYFRASDPDGDMKFVLTDAGVKADQMGRPIYPGANRLRGEQQKSVSGYLGWDSHRAVAVEKGATVSGTIAIWVEDAAWNSSEKKFLPVKIMPNEAKVQKPPAGQFPEILIGSIVVDTRNLTPK